MSNSDLSNNLHFVGRVAVSGIITCMGSERRTRAELEEHGIVGVEADKALAAIEEFTRAGDNFSDAIYEWLTLKEKTISDELIQQILTRLQEAATVLRSIDTDVPN